MVAHKASQISCRLWGGMPFFKPQEKTSQGITVQAINKVVCDYFNVNTSDMKSKKKNKSLVQPRQISMYLAKELTSYSFTEIGSEFGGRDHTTIMKSGLYTSDATLSWIALAGKYFSIIAIPDATHYGVALTEKAKTESDLALTSSIYLTRPAVKSAHTSDTFRFYIGPQLKKNMPWSPAPCLWLFEVVEFTPIAISGLCFLIRLMMVSDSASNPQCGTV